MHAAIRSRLDERGGIATAAELIAVSSRAALDWAIRRRHVHPVLPGVYARPDLTWDIPSRLRAALAWAGPEAAGSHSTALELYGLPAPADLTTHLEVPRSSTLRNRRNLALHRPRVARRDTWLVGGLRCVSAERAVIGAWHLLRDDDQRAPVIVGTQRRIVTTAALRAELDAFPRLPGRARLLALLALIDDGCDSALELWGRKNVFTGPGFDRLIWRHPVRVRGRSFRLDAFDPSSRTGIELDGHAYHSTPQQKNRDDERTRFLAEAGILVIRFGRSELHRRPARCREQALRVMAQRRQDPM